MEYEIKGDTLPVVECYLRENETIICQNGAMSWMSSNMHMETKGGGLSKMFSRAISGENIFLNHYTPMGGNGSIAFASSLPGSIMALEINKTKEYICQKGSFLACTAGVEMETFFNKRVGAGLLGGEGFIMQRFTGEGVVFIEIDGSSVVKDLKAGESIFLDTGHLAVMESTCSIDIVSVEGLKNKFLGGEGLFNTKITGPGQIILQTMPLSKLSQSIAPTKKSGGLLGLLG